MSSSPSGVHFMTMGIQVDLQIFPCGPTRKPCGFLPKNSGHARRNLPDSSNCISGCGFRRVIAIDPGDSRSYTHFAVFLLMPLARIEEALKQLRLAEKAD